MSGFVFYRGASLIDGLNIVGVAIVSSKNSKTGNMVQTYIMPENISPLDASKSGADRSVCGDCKHRGKPTDDPAKKQAMERTCYVNLGQGPTIVFKGLQRGIYPAYDDAKHSAMLAGKMLRMGSWGDPAAIPAEYWLALKAKCSGHTAYTHNAKYNPQIIDLCMISADSKQHAIGSIAHTRRTFRVIPVQEWQNKGKKALIKNEILCPASKEMGYKSICSDCKLCSGNTIKAKSIAIVAHGASRNYV